MPNETGLEIETRNGLVVVTLDRPSALNALTNEMVLAFSNHLKTWATDPSIRAVLIKGAGEKAFCAGGDIRQLYDAKALGPVPTDFFYNEYGMNSLIHHFPKPYISILNGITMGGGVGISAPGHYRVATDRTLWAMPETAIGLFPDVGGSYFLPRLKGKLGLYLGLTGARLRAADTIYAGIATHYVPIVSLDELIQDLSDEIDVDAVINRFDKAVGEAPLRACRDQIDRLFSGDSVGAILTNLAADDGDWATKVAHNLQNMSPTSLKLSYAAYKYGAALEFDDVLKMEFRVVSHLMENNDFFEGVRALLIDRDNAPKWSPSTVAQVADSTVERYFSSLNSRELIL